jgi:hypothetical protein
MSTSLSAVFNSGRSLVEVACVKFAEFFILLNPKLCNVKFLRIVAATQARQKVVSYENWVISGGNLCARAVHSTVFHEALFPHMFQMNRICSHHMSIL